MSCVVGSVLDCPLDGTCRIRVAVHVVLYLARAQNANETDSIVVIVMKGMLAVLDQRHVC